MAIPSEGKPATILAPSKLAATGYELSRQIQAQEDKERERYEAAFEEVSGPYWSERDIAVNQVGAQLLQMATDPKYFNAKVGSNEHKVFIRAKAQFKRLLEQSSANQKRYEAEENFLRNNPDATGVDELKSYMESGETVGVIALDETTGNWLMNNEPLISSDYMAAPPRLSKIYIPYTSREFLDDIKVGDRTIDNGQIRRTTPKDVANQFEANWTMLAPNRKDDLVYAYARSIYGPEKTNDQLKVLLAGKVDPEDKQSTETYYDKYTKELKSLLIRQKKGELDFLETQDDTSDGDGGGVPEWMTKTKLKQLEPFKVGDKQWYGVSIPEEKGITPIIAGNATTKGKAVMVNAIYISDKGGIKISGQQLQNITDEVLSNMGEGKYTEQELANLLQETKALEEPIDISPDDLQKILAQSTDEAFKGSPQLSENIKRLLAIAKPPKKFPKLPPKPNQ